MTNTYFNFTKETHEERMAEVWAAVGHGLPETLVSIQEQFGEATRLLIEQQLDHMQPTATAAARLAENKAILQAKVEEVRDKKAGTAVGGGTSQALTESFGLSASNTAALTTSIER